MSWSRSSSACLSCIAKGVLVFQCLSLTSVAAAGCENDFSNGIGGYSLSSL